MQFHVIGDHESVIGFSLVGVPGTVATDRETASKALREAATREGVGIILITERLGAEVREEIDALIYEGDFPLVLEIPDRKGPVENRMDVREVVRRAIGVNI